LSRLSLGCTLGVVGLALGSGCSPAKPVETRSPFEDLDALLRPASQAASIRRLPSAHLVGTAMFRVSPAGPAADGAAGRDDRSPRDAVTTRTELWLDRRGQYRLVETNDQDGGRQVIRYGHDLAVALRYGKTIRRPALEPEPTRILEEAIGSPWAAWETVRRFATVTRVGSVYRVTRNRARVVVVHASGEAAALRQWRDAVEVQEVAGEARFEPRTGALLAFNLIAHFSAVRGDGVPVDGEVSVLTRTDGIGTTAAIVPPAAEELEPRPRSILDERALLGDLTREAGGKESR
jgi:hypothetical protein